MLPYIACRGLSTGTQASASAQGRGASNISLHNPAARATAGSALELSLVTLTIMLDAGDAQALHAGTVDGALP